MEDELELNQMLEMASGEVHDLLDKVSQLEAQSLFLDLRRVELRDALEHILDLVRTDLPPENFTPDSWNVHRLHAVAQIADRALSNPGK